MSDVKVFQLAKELGVSNNDLIAVLRELGVEVSNGSSVIDASTADTVKELVSQDKGIITQAKTIEIPQSLTVRELADVMGINSADVQKRLVQASTSR